MTKEELEKEAEEYTKANNLEWELECCRTSPIGEVKQAYLASAEPREKCIEELRLKIKHLTQHLEPQAMSALFDQVEKEVEQEQRIKELDYQKQARSIAENAVVDLTKENRELKDNFKIAKDNEYEYQSLYIKAKEIIRDFLSVAIDYIDPIDKNYSLIAEAEQFLNSEGCSDCFCEDCTKDCEIKKLGLVEEKK